MDSFFKEILMASKKKKKKEKKRKPIIKHFKDIAFGIDIQTNLKEEDFLDVALNLRNGTYRPHKKPNDKLLYIHSSSNNPPQIIKQLLNSISERLSKNSSNQEIFNTAKVKYEDALKKSVNNVDLKCTNNKSEKRKTRKQNIIWFKPPFSKFVSTSVVKTFLQLVTKHFPRNHKLHKIFSRNTLKVSYSYMSNMSKTIKGHNKPLLVIKGNKSLNILHPFFILGIALSNAPHLLLCHQNYKTSP